MLSAAGCYSTTAPCCCARLWQALPSASCHVMPRVAPGYAQGGLTPLSLTPSSHAEACIFVVPLHGLRAPLSVSRSFTRSHPCLAGAVCYAGTPSLTGVNSEKAAMATAPWTCRTPHTPIGAGTETRMGRHTPLTQSGSADGTAASARVWIANKSNKKGLHFMLVLHPSHRQQFLPGRVVSSSFTRCVPAPTPTSSMWLPPLWCSHYI